MRASGTNSLTRLSRSMPNVCQRNTVPESSFEAPPVICPFFEFGYQLGQVVASTICDQMFSQEAWMSSELCENRSALEGSKPCGQWMSFSRCVRSSFIVTAVFSFASLSPWPPLGVAWAHRIITAGPPYEETRPEAPPLSAFPLRRHRGGARQQL